MTTSQSEEFLALCGTDQFAFRMRHAPFTEGTPPRWMQRAVQDDVERQMDTHLAAIDRQYPDDLSRWIPVTARALRIVNIYIDAGFNELVPLREELRQPLYTRGRMSRRLIFARAMKCSDEEWPRYKALLRDPRLQGPGGAEDWAAAEAHVDHGTYLMEGLRQAAIIRKAAAIAAWRKAKLTGADVEANGEAALKAALEPTDGQHHHDAEHVHAAQAPPGDPSRVRVKAGTA
jgi:hypothetical protein